MALAPTINDLILPGTHITQARHDRFASQNLWEIDFTWILAWSNEKLERAVMRVLGEHGLDVPDDARLIAAHWLFPTRRDRRCPDLAVATRDTKADRWLPLALIEIKCFAWVNGSLGYCPQLPDNYSSQVTCYLHECWVPQDSVDKVRGLSRVWLTYDSKALDPLHGRGLTTRDVEHYPKLELDFERERAALPSWTILDWKDIAQGCQGDFAQLIRSKGLIAG